MSSLDTFSLEDEDYNELFITQSSSNDVGMEVQDNDSGEGKFLGLEKDDFSSPMVSLVGAHGIEYSDISEDEFEQETAMRSDVRWVLLL